MTSVVGKTARHTGIYTVGTILRRMVSLIMLPIYTRCLTPADYGVLELLSLVLDFVSIIVGMRVGQAIYRFYTRASTHAEKSSVISTALILVGVLNLLGVAAVWLGRGGISRLVLGNELYAGLLGLFSLSLVLHVFVEVPLVYIRARQQPWLFVGMSVLNLVLQVSLNIYFVVLRHMHVEGVVYSSLISGVIMSCLLLAYTLHHTGLRFDGSLARKMAGFSIPLMLTSMLSFYLTFGDRYFLRVFASLEEVGIYSLGYKFGFLLVSFTWTPFANSWDVQRYEVYRQQDARDQYARVFLLVSFVMIAVGLGIAVFVKDLLRIMSAPSFWSAAQVVPVILLAYLVQSWMSFCNLGVMLKGRTLYITGATLVAVLVITVGYVFLVPRFGAMGAAWATLSGFVVRFLLVDRVARRFYDMELPWGRVGLMLLVALGVFVLSRSAPEPLWASVMVHGLSWCLFPLAMLVLPVFSSELRRRVLSAVRNPLAAGRLLFVGGGRSVVEDES